MHAPSDNLSSLFDIWMCCEDEAPAYEAWIKRACDNEVILQEFNLIRVPRDINLSCPKCDNLLGFEKGHKYMFIDKLTAVSKAEFRDLFMYTLRSHSLDDKLQDCLFVNEEGDNTRAIKIKVKNNRLLVWNAEEKQFVRKMNLLTSPLSGDKKDEGFQQMFDFMMRFNRGYMLSKEEFTWLEEILEEAFDKQL